MNREKKIWKLSNEGLSRNSNTSHNGHRYNSNKTFNGGSVTNEIDDFQTRMLQADDETEDLEKEDDKLRYGWGNFKPGLVLYPKYFSL